MNAGKPCPTTPGCQGELATYSTSADYQKGIRTNYLKCNVCDLTPSYGGKDIFPLEDRPPRLAMRRAWARRKASERPEE